MIPATEQDYYTLQAALAVIRRLAAADGRQPDTMEARRFPSSHGCPGCLPFHSHSGHKHGRMRQLPDFGARLAQELEGLCIL